MTHAVTCARRGVGARRALGSPSPEPRRCSPRSGRPVPPVRHRPSAPSRPPSLDIMAAPKYQGATWGLRAVDVESGALVYSLGPDSLFFTGSVRKLFSVAEALDALGPGHRFTTPVHRRGPLGRDGVLHGDLVVVAERRPDARRADDALGRRRLHGLRPYGVQLAGQRDPHAPRAPRRHPDARAPGGCVGRSPRRGRRRHRRSALPEVPRPERQRADHAHHRQRQPDRRDDPPDAARSPGDASTGGRARPGSRCARRRAPSRAGATADHLADGLAGRAHRRGARVDPGRVPARSARSLDARADVHDRRPGGLRAHGADRGAAARGRDRHRADRGCEPRSAPPRAAQLPRADPRRALRVAALRRVLEAHPQGQPQLRRQPEPHVRRHDPGCNHARRRPRGRAAHARAPVRHPRGRLQVPHERQRQPRQPSDAGGADDAARGDEPAPDLRAVLRLAPIPRRRRLPRLRRPRPAERRDRTRLRPGVREDRDDDRPNRPQGAELRGLHRRGKREAARLRGVRQRRRLCEERRGCDRGLRGRGRDLGAPAGRQADGPRRPGAPGRRRNELLAGACGRAGGSSR